MLNNKFDLNFKQQGISVISKKAMDDKFIAFFNYLKFDIIITDTYNNTFTGKSKILLNQIDNESIIKTLTTLYDKCVFISVPINYWNKTSAGGIMDKSILIRSFMRKICSLTVDNNLSITLTHICYTSPISNIAISILYAASYFIHYEDEIFTVLKSRTGNNEKININDLSYFYIRKLRENKLKRIDKDFFI